MNTGGGIRKAEYRRIAATRRFLSYRCRCSRCEARHTFRKLPMHMRRTPRCGCGSRAWRVDWNRQLRRDRTRERCDCPLWEFPHRAGSCRRGGRAASYLESRCAA
jgi:hypothetical protein